MKFLPLILALILNATAFAKDEVIIGFTPSENADVVETNSKAFSAYYKEKTGKSVKTFIATDYAALIEALRSSRVDFAFLPPFSFVKAEKFADAKVLMKSVRKGRDVFYSAIITRNDKGIKSLEDLKGKNIAWVDPSSTSGHVFPKAGLITKKKLDPDKFFGKQIYAGGHDAAVLAVLNGSVDAAATYVNDKAGTDGSWTPLDKEKKIQVVFVTDAIPADTMATSNKFAAANKELVDLTVKLLGDMGKDEKGRKILTDLYRVDGMKPATSKDYDIVRAAAKVVGIDIN